MGVLIYAYLGGAFSAVCTLLLISGVMGKETITFAVLGIACTVIGYLEQRHHAGRR